MEGEPKSKIRRAVESPVVGLCAGLLATILLTIIPTMIHDVRWMLIGAWPLAILIVWEMTRILSVSRRTVRFSTGSGALISGVALWFLYLSLAPEVALSPAVAAREGIAPIPVASLQYSSTSINLQVSVGHKFPPSVLPIVILKNTNNALLKYNSTLITTVNGVSSISNEGGFVYQGAFVSLSSKRMTIPAMKIVPNQDPKLTVTMRYEVLYASVDDPGTIRRTGRTITIDERIVLPPAKAGTGARMSLPIVFSDAIEE